MDADVTTIETFRSNMELLDAFGAFSDPNEVAPEPTMSTRRGWLRQRI